MPAGPLEAVMCEQMLTKDLYQLKIAGERETSLDGDTYFNPSAQVLLLIVGVVREGLLEMWNHSLV